MAEAKEALVALTNTQDKPVRLVIEPWYAEFAVPSGAPIEIHVSSFEAGEHETEVIDGEITVWLWSGSTARVIVDGVDVTGGQMSLPVPVVPSGGSVRGLMDLTGLSDIKIPTITVCDDETGQ